MTKADIKIAIIFIVGSFSAMALFSGMIANQSKCTYNTILKRLAIPFVIGCELTKKRDW